MQLVSPVFVCSTQGKEASLQSFLLFIRALIEWTQEPLSRNCSLTGSCRRLCFLLEWKDLVVLLDHLLDFLQVAQLFALFHLVDRDGADVRVASMLFNLLLTDVDIDELLFDIVDAVGLTHSDGDLRLVLEVIHSSS